MKIPISMAWKLISSLCLCFQSREWQKIIPPMRSPGTVSSGMSYSIISCKIFEETRTHPENDLMVKHYEYVRSIRFWSSFCVFHSILRIFA